MIIVALIPLMLADKNGDRIIIRPVDGSERAYHLVFEVEENMPDPIVELEAFRTEARGSAA